jgi:thiol-disulfide isomerase/thioredoxin
MRTRWIIAAAVAAGTLGLLASLRVDRSWLARTDVVQDALKQPKAGAAPPPVAVAREGDALPALALPDPDGRRFDLAVLTRGRPALLNVWATWCGPCVKEMPMLDAFHRAQAPNGVQVVGIALDDPGAVKDFMARYRIGYTSLVDVPGKADAGVRLGNPRGVLPFSVLISADGRILEQWVGPLEQGDLDAWAARATAAPTRD